MPPMPPRPAQQAPSAPPPQPSQPPAPRRSRRVGVLLGAGVLGVSLLSAGIGAATAVGLNDADDGAEPAGTSVVTGADLPADEGSVQQVADAVLPAVVQIKVSGPGGSGSGSGVVISAEGQILTNDHVVAAADGGRITVSFTDGTSAPARIVGTDPVTDLAVIAAEGVSDLTPATIATGDHVDVGEEVVAIGSPFGLAATVTSGIVSALDRPVTVGQSANGVDTTYPAIQTDAAINPGNSGGPLVNMAGEVVGINSSIRTASSSAYGESESGSIGLGFAIPISKVWPIVEQLLAGDPATHARIGVSVRDVVSEDGLVSGAGVQQVEEGSAAAGAGLRAGDVITKVDDFVVTDSESLIAFIRGERPGDEVSLTVVRDDEPRSIDIELDSDARSSGS